MLEYKSDLWLNVQSFKLIHSWNKIKGDTLNLSNKVVKNLYKDNYSYEYYFGNEYSTSCITSIFIVTSQF